MPFPYTYLKYSVSEMRFEPTPGLYRPSSGFGVNRCVSYNKSRSAEDDVLPPLTKSWISH